MKCLLKHIAHKLYYTSTSDFYLALLFFAYILAVLFFLTIAIFEGQYWILYLFGLGFSIGFSMRYINRYFNRILVEVEGEHRAK